MTLAKKLRNGKGLGCNFSEGIADIFWQTNDQYISRISWPKNSAMTALTHGVHLYNHSFPNSKSKHIKNLELQKSFRILHMRKNDFVSVFTAFSTPILTQTLIIVGNSINSTEIVAK
jgi:hypothetical protein